MSAGDRDTPAIERFLRDHPYMLGRCHCGYGADRNFGISTNQHRAHLADVLLASDWLREQRAEAFDPKFREFASRSRVFWTFVDHSETGCWIWTGSRKGENNEYGGYAGTTAHRVSWALANGRSARPGEVVRHRCDNGLCVRPDHLEIGTQQDNVDDAVERGRMWFQNRKECKRGHPVTEENTYVYPTRAKTECLTCRKARQAKRNAAYRTTEDTESSQTT